MSSYSTITLALATRVCVCMSFVAVVCNISLNLKSDKPGHGITALFVGQATTVYWSVYVEKSSMKITFSTTDNQSTQTDRQLYCTNSLNGPKSYKNMNGQGRSGANVGFATVHVFVCLLFRSDFVSISMSPTLRGLRTKQKLL